MLDSKILAREQLRTGPWESIIKISLLLMSFMKCSAGPNPALPWVSIWLACEVSTGSETVQQYVGRCHSQGCHGYMLHLVVVLGYSSFQAPPPTHIFADEFHVLFYFY